MKKQQATDNLAMVDSTLQQWMGFKRFVMKSFSQEPITPEDEQEFLEIKSLVNKNTRVMNERLKDIGFESDKIGAILRQCISVSQLRAMPVPERRGLYKEWHSAYVNLNQMLGAVEFLTEGWIPKATRTTSGTSIAEIKGRNSDAKARGKGKTVTIVVVVLVVGAAAAYFLMN